MKRVFRLFFLPAALSVSGLAYSQKISPQAVLEQSYASRPAVKAALLNIKAAQNSKRILGAYPAVRFETGFATRPDVGGGEDLSLFVPVDVFGRTANGRSLGFTEILMAEANLRQVLLDVQTEVLQAYITLATAQRLVTTSEESLSVSERLYKATEVLVQARKVPDIQRIRAEFEVRRAAQIVVDRKALAKAAATRLQAVMGAPEPISGSVDIEAFSESMIGRIDLRETRPDLQVLRVEQQKAEIEVSAAKLLRLPTLEAQLRRSTWSATNVQYGARLQLSVPLWDDKLSVSTGRVASLRRDAVAQKLKGLTLTAAREREAAQIEFDAAAISVQAYAGLIGEAGVVLNKIQRGFELGAATLVDVLEARRTLTDVLEQGVASRQRYDIAVEEILRVQGQILVGLKS